MNIAESMALTALKSSKMASAAAYTAAKSATSVPSPFVLQFFCIIHQKILNDESRIAMGELFKNELSMLHTKYEMVTVMCQNENVDPMGFIREHQSMVESMLVEIGMDPHIIQSEETLRQYINQNIKNIIEYIKKKTELLKQLKLTGGTRKRTKKSKRSRRRK